MTNSNVSQIDNLEELLVDWQSKFPEGLHFNIDGIISVDDWEKCDVKVLFVLKETNKAKQNIVSAINRALTTKKSGWWKGKVLRRVGRWAYGLQNYNGEVPAIRDAKLNLKAAIKSIAYINIRKTAGGARTNKKSFDAHAAEFAPYVRRQIELIKPDIIVLGGTYKQIKKYVFPELSKVSERVHKHEDMLFINAFHPAAVKQASILYQQVVGNYHNYKKENMN
ncbi:hypothetical protein [Pseudoalteromonas sp. G4]|uniref:hypothetical protein n=1 Tax=Pseudoalteromonas sp. G4 TaxID=2992761 RepID=UPI00237DB96E|nr:hypothetical protein [Pseudoalteromonas sp. G4]MDE3272517.1 uracil-DNA glycosylase family protein [Pseudoalteromonas sp. G4]